MENMIRNLKRNKDIIAIILLIAISVGLFASPSLANPVQAYEADKDVSGDIEVGVDQCGNFTVCFPDGSNATYNPETGDWVVLVSAQTIMVIVEGALQVTTEVIECATKFVVDIIGETCNFVSSIFSSSAKVED